MPVRHLLAVLLFDGRKMSFSAGVLCSHGHILMEAKGKFSPLDYADARWNKYSALFQGSWRLHSDARLYLASTLGFPYKAESRGSCSPTGA